MSSCAVTADRWASQLPEVSDEDAVTLTGRSILNVSEIQHEHILKIDGLIAGRFKSDQVKSFKIPSGKHNLSLNCYTSVIRKGNTEIPFNYTVPDGKSNLDIDTSPGDEVCLKITYSLLNCSVLEDADPSYCERKN